MKKIAVFIFLSGFLLVGIGTFQFFQTSSKQNQALSEAKLLIEKSSIEKKMHNNEPIPPIQQIPADFNPEVGETVGLLQIPKLKADLPIIEGTDPDELIKGVGHYLGTAYPLQQDQIVLSGHRETVFRRMGELEIGDILTLQLSYGEFSYQITHTKIVSADDKTVIVPTSPNEVLTLTTCYPFNYIGNAPDRYIITAIPIDEEQ